VSGTTSGNALIRGGTVVDGKGGKPFAADVRVAAGRVTEIGANLAPRGEQVFDASGCYVTPGFIDTHTHYDTSLFWDPACDPILLHGVTTVLIGNCGLGLAPIKKHDIAGLSSLFSYVEDLPRAVFESEIPWNWESFPDYARVMRGRRYGVNVAALVSHSLMRMFEMGEAAWKRSATSQERARIGELLQEALRAGAFGFSTSRFDRNPKGELVPSYFADSAELDALFEITSAHQGLVQVIPDMGNLDTQEKDLREMGELSIRRGGTPVISNQIYQRPDDPTYDVRLIKTAHDLRARGANFHFLASPRSIELRVNFHQAMVFIYVSAWNELVQPDLPREEKLRRLRDPEWRAQARRDWDAVKEGFPSGGMERSFRIVTVNRPEYEQYLGMTFDTILKQRTGHPSDQLADWALENDLEAEFVFPFTNTDVAAVGRLLNAEESLISASDAGAHIGMFDGAGDSTLVLTRHVRDRGDLTLERAVKRMTADQAKLLGLRGRGVIEKDAVADLAVFDLAKLSWDIEKKLTDIPGGQARFRRPAGGYRFTFVSGELAQQEGKATGALAAKFLGNQDRFAAG